MARFLVCVLVLMGVLFAGGGRTVLIPAEVKFVADSFAGDWGRCLYATHTPCANTTVISASSETNWQIAQRRNCGGVAGSMVQHLLIFQFNTTAIPDSAIVEQLIFGLNVTSISTNNGMVNLHVMSRDMLDISGRPSEYFTDLERYNDATNGNSYFTGEAISPGVNEIYLNAQAESDFTDLLSEDWFAFSVLLDEFLDITDTCIAYVATPESQHYLKVTYHLPAAVRVQTSFDGGEVIVDGVTHSSPFDTTWISDETHTIGVDSVQTPGVGVKYEFRFWSDGGARVHEVIAADTAQTYTAYFDTFYQVVLNSPYGTTEGAGWYPPGSMVNISVSPETVYNADTTIRHVFGGWVGTGSGSYTGPSSSATIVVNGFIVEDAVWDTSYYLTVTSSGVPDTTPYLEGEGWHPPESWVHIFAQDSIFHDGVWYIFDHWSGGVFGDSTSNDDSVYLDYPITITAVYVPNPETEVFPPESVVARRGDGILLPAIMTAVVDVELDSFQFDLVFDTTALSFDTVEFASIPWSELSYSLLGDTVRVFVDQPSPTVVSPPETLFFYRFTVRTDAPFGCTQLEMLNFLYDLSDARTRPGTLCVRPETVAVVVTNDFGAGTVWVDYTPYAAPYSAEWLGGEAHTIGAESLYTPAEGVEVRFSMWSDGGAIEHTVAPISDTTFVAEYDSFFYLSVESDYGSPSGEGWYLAHTAATFSVSPETVYDASLCTRHVFLGWSGDYVGTDNPATIWMSAPSSVRALWGTEHLIVLDYTGCDGAVPTLAGGGWHAEGDTIPISASDFVTAGSDTFYFVQWVGGNVVDPFSSSTQACVLGPDTIVAQYGPTPFYMSVAPPETLFAPDELFPLPIVFDAPVPVSVSEGYVEVILDGASAVAVLPSGALWDSLDYSLIPGGVGAFVWGDATVSPGETLFSVLCDPGELTKFMVTTQDPSFDFAAAEVGSGEVFVSQPVLVQILTSHAGAAALINGESHALPYSAVASAWDTLVLDCDSVQSPDPYTTLSFSGWSDTAGVRLRSLVPEGDTTLTANFVQNECALTVVTEHCPGDSATSYYACGGDVVFCICADSVLEGESFYRFSGWTGFGPGAYSGPDSCHTITLAGNVVERANWTAFHHLSVSYSGCGGASPAVEGDGWYEEGTYASVSAPDSVNDGGVWYHFVFWDGPVSDRLSPSTTVLVDAPTSVVAVYGTASADVVVEPPDTTFAAPGEFFVVPIVLWGDATTDSVALTVHFDFGIMGVVDAFSPFDTLRISDHSTEGYVELSAWGDAVALSDGDTIFELVCVSRDTSGACVLAVSGVSGLGAAVGEDGVVEVGGVAHVTLRTCPGCTLVVLGDVYVDSFCADVPVGFSLEVDAPAVQGGDGARWVFDGWSDGGCRRRTLRVEGDTSAQALYRRQFYVDVSSPLGSVAGSGWYDEGESATFSVSPSSFEGDTVRWSFDRWVGEGDGSYDGADNPASISVIGAVSETALWRREFLVELASDGALADLEGGGFYREGERASVYAPPQVGDARFVTWSGGTFADSTNHSTRLLVDGHVVAVAHYSPNFVAPAVTEALVGDTFCVPIVYHGDAVFVDTAEVVVRFAGGIVEFLSASECGAFALEIDTTCTGTLTMIGVTLNSPSYVDVNEGDTLFCLCFVAVTEGNALIEVLQPSGDLLGVAGGEGEVVVGLAASVHIGGIDGGPVFWDGVEHTAPFDTTAVVGSRHTVSVPETVVVGGERFTFAGWSDGGAATHVVRIEGDTSLVAAFDVAFWVEVSTPYGAVSGGGWYDEGDSALVFAYPETVYEGATRHAFSGWSGTISSAENPLRFAVTRAETLQALWSTQHYLDVISEFGSVWGEGWKDDWVLAWAGVSPETVYVSDGLRAVFIGWGGDTSGYINPVGFVMNEPKRLVALWKRQYRVAGGSDRGTVEGDGWYDEGDTACLRVTPSSIDSTEGVRWAFDGWFTSAGVFAETTVCFEVAAPESAWVDWGLQYYLFVDGGGHGSATPPGWYDAGEEVVVSVDPDMEVVGEGVRWAFVGWSGAYSGDENPASFRLLGPDTVTALWERQFYLSVTDSGAGASHPELEGEGYHPAGAEVSVCAQQVAYEGEVRYHFVRWSGATFDDDSSRCATLILDTTRTVVAHYSPYEVSPQDTITGALGETLVVPIILYNDALTAINTIQFTLFYPTALLTYLGVEDPPGISWSTLTGSPGGDSLVIFASIANVYVTPPETLVLVKFRVSGSGADSMWCGHFRYSISGATGSRSAVFVGDPVPVTVTTDLPGTSYVMVDGMWVSAPFDTSWLPGEPHTISAPPVVAPTSTSVFVFDGWSDGGERTHVVSASAPDTFVAGYAVWYKLSVESEHGSAWGGGWYDAGSVVDFGVGPACVQEGGSRYSFSGWEGAGDGSYSGPERFAQATVNGPITQTALWDAEHFVFVESERAAVTGGGWYAEGETATVSCYPSVVESTQAVRFSFGGWFGTAASSDNPFSFAVLRAESLRALWRRELLVVVESPRGVASGGGWYEEGENAHISISPAVEDSAGVVRFEFAGWEGTVDTPAVEFDLAVHAPETLFARWRRLVRVDVLSDWGTVCGGGFYAPGETVVVAALQESVDVDGTKIVFVGWAVGGDTLAENPLSLVVGAEPETVRAVWTTLYQLTVTSPYSTTFGGGWYAEGAEVSFGVNEVGIELTPHDSVKLEGWRGTGIYSYTGGGNPASVVVESPIVEEALWGVYHEVSVSSDYGFAYGGGWYRDGDTASFGVTPETLVCDGFEVRFSRWGGDYVGTENPHAVVVDTAVSVFAVWDTLWLVVTGYTGCGGAVVEVSGGGYYPAGETVVVAAPNLVYDGAQRFHFDHWTGTVADADENPLAFVPAGPETAVAVYSAFEVSMPGTVTAAPSETIDVPVILYDTAAVDLDTIGLDVVFDGASLSPVSLVDPGIGWDTLGLFDLGGRARIFAARASGYSASPPETLVFVRFAVSTTPVSGTMHCDSARYDIASAGTVPSLFVPQEGFGVALSTSCGCSLLVDGSPEASPFSTTWTGGSLHEVAAFDTVFGAAGERFVFVGWSDGVASPQRSLLVSSDTSLCAQYVREIAVGVFNDRGFGEPQPPVGTYWLAEGDTLVASAGSPDREAHAYCTGYVGAGAIPDGFGDLVALAPDSAGALFWMWGGMVPLFVASPYGLPVPAGTVWCQPGESVFASVDSLVYDGAYVRHVCVGFDGYGGISPTGGAGCSGAFEVSDTAQLVWRWRDEYRLSLAACGAADAAVTTSGAGWYPAESTAYISVDTEAVASDGAHYFFLHWSSVPAGGSFDDSLAPSTGISMDGAYTAVAHFVQGARVAVRKQPLHASGWLSVDGETFAGAESVVVWRRVGDTVVVAASPVDTVAPDSAYIFRGWSFDSSETAAVAVTGDAELSANYDVAYRIVLSKVPPETLGALVVDDTVYTGASSALYRGWWISGSEHVVEASDVDSVAPDVRWCFAGWSDGEGSSRRVLVSSAPESIAALYAKKFRLVVTKSPPEPYGTVTIGGDVVLGASALAWVWQDSAVVVSVSGHDVAPPCSIYTFSGWSDGVPDSERTVVADTSTSLVANYVGDTVKLDIELSSNLWSISDTLGLEETYTLPAGDVFVITNNSSLPVRFGLAVSDGGGLSCGCVPGTDRFVLRAKFNDDSSAGVFSRSRDCVRAELVWATEDLFGAGGASVPPGDTENLWLQIVTPRDISSEGTYTIILTLWCRVVLP